MASGISGCCESFLVPRRADLRVPCAASSVLEFGSAKTLYACVVARVRMRSRTRRQAATTPLNALRMPG
jgi:hypothetical protein